MQMNKQGTFSSGMYSCSMRGTVIATTEHQWPYWSYQNVQLRKMQMTALRLLCTFLIYPPLMHKQNDYDITKWCQNHVLPLFSGKGTVHAQESHTDLPVHPPVSLLTIFHSYAQTMSSFPYPEFWASDTLLQVFWCALISEFKIYSNTICTAT